VGSKDQIDVKQVAAIVSKVMGLTPRYKFTGGIDGGRGWKGDVTNMILDIRKMQSLGWQPKHSSAEAVLMTAKQLQNWNAVGRGTLSS
jgi:UDP-glucose 4-epimerase